MEGMDKNERVKRRGKMEREGRSNDEGKGQGEDGRIEKRYDLILQTF